MDQAAVKYLCLGEIFVKIHFIGTIFLLEESFNGNDRIFGILVNISTDHYGAI